MKQNKIAMVKIKGKNEAGEVIQENKKTVLLKFHHVADQPVIKKKKNQCKLILGDTWNN